MRSGRFSQGLLGLCLLFLLVTTGCRKVKNAANFCLRDRECAAEQMCLSGRCAAKPAPGAEGEACSERLVCGAELICRDGTCQTLAPVRGSVCERQSDCGASLACTGGFCEEPPPATVCNCSASPTDRDGDCLPDSIEDTNQNGSFDTGDFTDLTVPDSDADGVLDGCEDGNHNGVVDLFPPEADPRSADSDGDLLSDGVEDANRNGYYDPGETDATAPDTDADGYDDGSEDRNHDGLWNCPENPAGPPCEINPRAYDTDLDGLPDFVELKNLDSFVLWLTPGPGQSPTPADALCSAPGAVPFEGADATLLTDDDQTCPWQADSDGDGIGDGKEDRNGDGLVSTGEPNPRLSDSDGDGLADGVEDANLDGLYDRLNETDPGRVDSDGDGLGDGIEDSGGCLTVANLCSQEPVDGTCDCAGWRNGRFDAHESDPRLPDTDLDGLRDGVEDQNGDGVCQRPRAQDVPRSSDETCSYLADSDGDGLNEGAEDLNGNGQIEFGETDARRADPDNDCATDTYEVFVQTDPFDPDTDADGLPDGLETQGLRYDGPTHSCIQVDCGGGGVAYQTETCTNPRIRDSDGDGLVDGFENLNGFVTGEDVDADGCRISAESNPCIADANQPPATDGNPACTLDFSVTSCPKTPVNGCSACLDSACSGNPTCLVGPCTPGSPCEKARKEAQALICAEGNIKPVVLVRSIENDYTLALAGVQGPFGAPDSLYDFQTLYLQGAPIGSVFQSIDGRSNVEPQPVRSVFGSILRLGTLELGTGCDVVTDDPPVLDTLLAAPPSGACVPPQNYVVGSSSYAPSDVAERSFLRVNQQLQGAGYSVQRTSGGNLRAHDDESSSGISSAARIDYAVDRYTVRKTGGGAVDPYVLKRTVIGALLGGNTYEEDLPAPAGYYEQGIVADLRIQFYRRFVQQRVFLSDGTSEFRSIAQYGAVFALATVARDCANETDKLACKADVERFSLPVDDLTNGSALARYQAEVSRSCDAYDPAASKADFLVVIDDSGSMQNFIRSIQTATRDVASRLNANNENMDWRIALTTSNMGRAAADGTPLPHPGVADRYEPFDVVYDKLDPNGPVPTTLFEYQTTAYAANGNVQRCKYKDSFTGDPLESPYCCDYVGNSTEDYLVKCCSIAAATTVPPFYDTLVTANSPDLNFADNSTTLGAGIDGNDTLRCWDFPRVGDAHQMLSGFSFYPSTIASSPTSSQRRRHLLDYLCGDGAGSDEVRPVWGAKGQLWPPGFQGFNGEILGDGSYKHCVSPSDCSAGSSCVDGFCLNPRKNGANLLIRNADMLVTQMNRDCGATSNFGTRSPRVRAGSGAEQTLQAAKRAAERATANGRGTGQYQLRPDAPLITILLSDEEDYTTKWTNLDRYNSNPALDRSARDNNQLPPARCLFNGDQGCSIDYCQNTCFAAQTDQGSNALNIPSARRFEAGSVKRTEANRNAYCVAPQGTGEPSQVCSATGAGCATPEVRWNGLHRIDSAVDENLTAATLDMTAPSPDPSQATGSNVPSRDVLNIAQSATAVCDSACGSDCLPCARYLRERQYIDFFNGTCSPPDGTTPVPGDIRRFERPAIDLGANGSLVMPTGFVYAITRRPGQQGGSSGSCGSTYEGGDGNAYRDVSLASGGRVADICLADSTGFSDFLDQVIVDAQGIGSPYRLSGNPISSTIRVGVLAKDGTFRLLKRSSVSGFDYNSQTRSVAFFSRDANDSFNQVVPTRDARVFVSYRVWTARCGLDCALGDVCAVCTCSASNPECCTSAPTFQCRTPTPCVAGCGPCQECDPNSNQCKPVDPCGGCTAGTPFCVAQPNGSYSCQACAPGTTAVAIPCDNGEGGVCPGEPQYVCVSQSGIPNDGTTCAVLPDSPSHQDCCGAEKVCDPGEVCVLAPCPGESCRPTASCMSPNGNGTPTVDFCGGSCPSGTLCAPVPCSDPSGVCPPQFSCIASNPGGSATCQVNAQCSCPGNVCADCPVGQSCSLDSQCVPLCAADVSVIECCTQPGISCCPSGEQFDPTTSTCKAGTGCPVACAANQFCDPIAGVCRNRGG